ATDNRDGPVLATCSPPSGTSFALGTTTVNCSASDSHNNTATGSFTVMVRDIVPPLVRIVSPGPDDLITTSPATVIVETTDVDGVAEVRVSGFPAVPINGVAGAGRQATGTCAAQSLLAARVTPAGP